MPPPTKNCWDRDLFITNGFTPGSQCVATFGVPRTIQSLVWHDLEGYLAGAVAHWNTGAAGAHLVIMRDGEVVRCVRFEDVAWHAGTDQSTGRTTFWKTHNVNPYSIGVELEGFYNQAYTPGQAQAVRRIARWFEQHYGVLRKHTWDQIVGHHAHSEISNQRADPGAGFSWSWVEG